MTPQKQITVYLLPFAGGSSYSYSDFRKYSTAQVRFTPIELPGRGRRIGEPLLDNIDDICIDVLRGISMNIENNAFAVYGHSMGSIVGYRLARLLNEKGLRQPVHLFFSGRQGPSVNSDGTCRHLLSKEDLEKELRELGGVPEEVLADASLMEIFEPILRADFKAVDSFKYTAPSMLLDIPITVWHGDQEKLTYAEMLAWQRETTQPLAVHQLPGDHFFILNNIEKLASAMIGYLTNGVNTGLARHVF